MLSTPVVTAGQAPVAAPLRASVKPLLLPTHLALRRFICVLLSGFVLSVVDTFLGVPFKGSVYETVLTGVLTLSHVCSMCGLWLGRPLASWVG